ncbi:hypothetical protein M438DRAFT_342251 [Aureobasidium pullulans EXF-150]|uniref:Uncharacterized protein n=1 Tax=Aureobasidium pullulans EXF-150 TaxID=1043002 RepID=A0A074YPC6_AURPU|nr:uncharacterized protein M438DRAFT_342251 [Aureobasidium pullulans EXF-150]KEQ88691.1 hypothetical protein M438DRAFT_342251 [Aureobasidium pullulans EXF-150]
MELKTDLSVGRNRKSSSEWWNPKYQGFNCIAPSFPSPWLSSFADFNLTFIGGLSVNP